MVPSKDIQRDIIGVRIIIIVSDSSDNLCTKISFPDHASLFTVVTLPISFRFITAPKCSKNATLGRLFRSELQITSFLR